MSFSSVDNREEFADVVVVVLDPPAVVGVGATFEITLVDKDVHELANGLLRNAKFGQKILPRPAGGVYPRQDEDAVPR